MKNYDHYISIGYFCSVAMELERMGLRSASYPFDWLVTPSLEAVLDLISNGFEDFLSYDLLFQDSARHEIYINEKYRCSFVHDFDKYKTLKEQLPGVCDKYKRRIDRFYKDVAKPTLFLRYINDESRDPDGRITELKHISADLPGIDSVIRSFNPDNEILWIGNDGISVDGINIYNVTPDDNDNVARRPFEKNPELNRIFTEADYAGRDRNVQIYLDKQRRKKSMINRVKKKAGSRIKEIFLKEYIHS